MESEKSLISFSLIPNLDVVCATEQDMISFLTFLCKVWAQISCDGTICVQSPEVWILSENMLQNSTKILVCEQVLLHASFSHDNVHAIVLRKQSLAQNDSNLEI